MSCKKCKNTERKVYAKGVCKSCYQIAYIKNKFRDMKEFADEVKTTLGCVDCGYNQEACALDFDHISSKTYSISKIFRGKHGNVSINELIDELSVCEVRCANCHRIKTHQNEDYKN